MHPRFSIITVTFNAASTVGRTVESVAAQTYTDYEHIIVDGGSTDSTLLTAASAPGAERRRVQSEPDNGIYDAMNKGLGLSRGDYLIFLNAGDKFHSTDTLARISAMIDGDEMPGVVYGQTVVVDDNGQVIGPRHLTAPPGLKYKDFARGMLVCHQAFVVLKRIAPLYNTKYKLSADYEWCLKCLQHSRHNSYIDDTLIDYLNEGATTKHRAASLIERFRIMTHYYGLLPTVGRHAGFALRFLKNKLLRKVH